jgi:hypothetical protein
MRTSEGEHPATKIGKVLKQSVGSESDICIVMSDVAELGAISASVMEAFAEFPIDGWVVDKTSVNFVIRPEDEAIALRCAECLLGICTQNDGCIRTLTVFPPDSEPMEYRVAELRAAA